jgi:maleamate amidohydrolase
MGRLSRLGHHRFLHGLSRAELTALCRRRGGTRLSGTVAERGAHRPCTPGGGDGGVFYRKVPLLKTFEAGSPLALPPAQLAPRADEIVIVKQYASAFFGTSFAATLTSRGIDTLVVAGVSTSGCVRATAVDACQNGFVPFVCRDAVGDRHPSPHEANLFDLAAKYAEVVGEDFILERFRAAAGSNRT